MTKRFTDTEKYKKPFIRGLQGAYKVLWDYLYHDCNHAGIWHVDFEVAQIYVGKDLPINEKDALEYFNTGEQRIIVFDGGKKWLIKPFIDFQYGHLNPENRVHSSILAQVGKIKNKGLVRSLQGSMDMDMDMDTDKGGAGDFNTFYKTYPRKVGKEAARKAFTKIKPELYPAILKAIEEHKKRQQWMDSDGKFIPHPATWLNQKRWEDEENIDVHKQKPKKGCTFCDGSGYVPHSGNKCGCWK